MDYIDLESPEVGYERSTLISPWDLIQTRLIQELDGDQGLFQSVLQRSTNTFGANSMDHIRNATEYFEFLNNNLGDEENIIEFMIRIVDLIELHSHQGTRPVKEVLIDCREQLLRHKEMCARNAISKDVDFIGRQKELDLIQKTLTGDTENKYKGVVICGLGGMGKTSLGNEICYRLLHSARKWNVIRIDMREKEELVDLLMDLVVGIGEPCSNRDEIYLKEQFLKGFASIKSRTIFFMDNLDGMIKTDYMKKELVKFLNDFISTISSLDKEIRVLVTVREKLHSVNFITKTIRYISNYISKRSEPLEYSFLEIELHQLTQMDAVDLLKKLIHRPLDPDPDNEVCQKIVRRCGGSPLAIKAVGSAIRSGYLTADAVAKNLQISIPELERVSLCLEQTFRNVDKDKQETMIKLSVFQTAKFDLDAACAILEIPGCRIKEQTEATLIYLKSRHLVEISDDISYRLEEECSRSQKSVKFSIHPLVFEYLRSVINSGTFDVIVREAKCKFCRYIERKNNEIMNRLDRNCVKAWLLLKEYKVHLTNYYHIVIHSKDIFEKSYSRSIFECKRVSESADLFVDDRDKFKLLDAFIEDCRAREKFLELALWQIHLGRKYFDVDRNEIAEGILNCIRSETLANVFYKPSEKESVVQVFGAFFYLYGRICLKNQNIVMALQNFKAAECLWDDELIRESYKTDLAWVYNSTAAAYARTKPHRDLVSSKKYHNKALRRVKAVSSKLYHVDIPLYVRNIGQCCYRMGNEVESNGDYFKAMNLYREAEEKIDTSLRLHVEFKMDKFDSYAEALRSRALVLMKIGSIDLAEKVAKEAYELRKDILSPPHVAITVTLHTVALVLISKAIKIYKSYKSGQGDLQMSLRTVKEALVLYGCLTQFIKQGGLPVEHEEYPEIKNNHMWLLIQIQDDAKISSIKEFYKNFENGKFEHIRRKRHTKEETLRFVDTYDELKDLIHPVPSGGDFMFEVTLPSDDAEEIQDESLSQSDPIFNPRRTRLNFRSVLKRGRNTSDSNYMEDGDDFLEDELYELDMNDVRKHSVETLGHSQRDDSDENGEGENESKTTQEFWDLISNQNIPRRHEKTSRDSYGVEQKSKRGSSSRHSSLQEILQNISISSRTRSSEGSVQEVVVNTSRKRTRSTSKMSISNSFDDDVFEDDNQDRITLTSLLDSFYEQICRNNEHISDTSDLKRKKIRHT